MKQSKILSAIVIWFIVFQALELTCQGQTPAGNKENPLSFEIGFARTNILGITFPGMNAHYIFFLSKRIGTGLSLFTVQSQVNQNFGYSIINPQVLFNQYGWINQFILINNKYIKLKLNFTNGLSQIRILQDSRQYNSGQYIFPPNLARDFYYFVQPGTDLSLRLFSSLYLTGGLNYRFLFGKGNFSNRRDFQNSSFCLGLTVMNSKK